MRISETIIFESAIIYLVRKNKKPPKWLIEIFIMACLFNNGVSDYEDIEPLKNRVLANVNLSGV